MNTTRSKKQFYLTSYIVLGISVLLWNCEKNDDIEPIKNRLENHNKYEMFFDSDLISERLELGRNNIYVDWDNPYILEISKNSQEEVYQFDIIMKKAINNNSDLFIKKMIYKLIVTEKEGNTSIKLLRFEPFKYSGNKDPSETRLESFSGMKFNFQ